MSEYITINPNITELKGVSPFLDDELTSIKINKTKYDDISNLINEFHITGKQDDFCYILILLEQERNHSSKEKDNSYYIDLKEYKKIFDLINEKGLLSPKPSSIKIVYNNKEAVEIGKKLKPTIDVEKINETFTFRNEKTIQLFLELLSSQYHNQLLTKVGYNTIIDDTVKANKSNKLVYSVAHNVKKYLDSTHTQLSELKRNAIAGRLFYLANYPNNWSEKEWEKAKLKYMTGKSNDDTTKSYNRWIANKFRTTYLK